MDKKIEFEDAQRLAKQYPDTFYAPDTADLNNIKPGDFVKVCAYLERFWIEVLSVEGDNITGRINNHLITDELSFDEIINVEARHVYDILPPPPAPKKNIANRKGKGLR